jgi:ketosteroid isomerase-like protein
VNAASNLDAIRRFHAAMETGDRDALIEMVLGLAHPEAEWSPLVTAVEGQSYRGKEGVLEFFTDFLESFEVRYDDLELRPIGDRAVLALAQMALEGRGSGVAVVQELGVLYEFEDGRMRHGRAYPSHAEALSAAEGLG